MKQLSQDYRTGEFRLEEVPMPTVRPGHLLVRTQASAVSVGTERQTVDLARKSLLGKALARPDLVRQVLAKVRMEGPAAAWRASTARLEAPIPLGYSSSGIVVEVGEGVQDFQVGDLVACTGQGYAGHAEMVLVPTRLCGKVAAGVTAESAAFGAIGGIALHACRLARGKPGDAVVVIGLGLLGQIAVQVLRGWGLRVFGVDVAEARVKLARELGAEEGGSGTVIDLAQRIRAWAGPGGARAAIILAATPSNEPLELAAEACGDRGRVVASGLVGLQVPRKPFFEKELELVVSRAWGAGSLPGAAQPREGEASARGAIEEFLALMEKGEVRMDRIVTHRFSFDRALEAYDVLLAGREPVLGVVLEYAGEPANLGRVPIPAARAVKPAGEALGVGVIGAGLFARGVMLPLLAKQRVRRLGLATNRPVEARRIAERYGFSYAAGDAEEILADPDVGAVFILTRHGSHAELAARALGAGKAVFLEKPLATDPEGVRRILAAHGRAERDGLQPFLMVGFNRRYAAATRFVVDALGPGHGPLAIHMTVNAGAVESTSWQHDTNEGGGRIIGEACHFVDLAQALTSSLPASVSAVAIGSSAVHEDVSLTLRMLDGSVATILYTSRGSRRHPRERIEVVGDGAVAVIDNFRAASFVGPRGRRTFRHPFSVERGYREEVEAFITRVAERAPPPQALAEHVATTRATFAAMESLAKGGGVEVQVEGVR